VAAAAAGPLAAQATKAAQGKNGAKPEAEKALVVRAKRLHLADGSIVENGVLVAEGGKIRALGADVPVPSGAVEWEASDVTPGFVEAACVAGQRGSGNEESSEFTATHRALDNLDPTDREFETLVSHGVTSAFVQPNSRNIIGGFGAVVKTAGVSPRVVAPDACLVGALGDTPQFGNFTPRGFGLPQSYRVRRPGSRPGVVMELRVALFEAERMVGKLGVVPDDKKPLVDLLEAGKPLRLKADMLVDLRAALRVAAEFRLKGLVVEGAYEAHRVIDGLRAAEAKVVLAPHAVHPVAGTTAEGRGFDFGEDRPAQDLVARLSAAGIPVAQSARGASHHDSLAQQMRLAVRYGASRAAALRAVTAGPAEILGVGDRLGDLRAGLEADLVLWNGDPFESTSAPVAVIVDGAVAWKK
jgi:imidazolonepropionase-like amidohydrolase